MAKKKEQKFEEMLSRLQEISDLLESEETGIDQTIELYEEGTLLSKKCAAKLKEAEVKITELNKDLEENISAESEDSE